MKPSLAGFMLAKAKEVTSALGLGAGKAVAKYWRTKRVSRFGKITLWILGVGSVLLILFVVFRIGIWDRANVPFCHKQMTLALSIWADDNTGALPNVEGNSLRSMRAMTEELAGTTNIVFRDYHYIPGLQTNDPRDLVLFYFNHPTRWRLHVQRPPTIWDRKTWIVVPLDAFVYAGDGRDLREVGHGPEQVITFGEQSQSLTTEQFTNRLIATLEFLRTNNRPHWQAVAKEHTAFLESISHKR